MVDDNEDAAASLSDLLTLDGHRVRTALGGVEALQVVRDDMPEFILLDIGMPDMDGCEVPSRLRAMEPQRRMKIVALTGWGQRDDRRRTHEAGFDAHLVKPLNYEKLRELLAHG